jgi:hypothetical protein
MPPGIASETAEQIDSRVHEQKQAGTDFIEGFADDIREAARPSPHAASTQLLIMPRWKPSGAACRPREARAWTSWT